MCSKFGNGCGFIVLIIWCGLAVVVANASELVFGGDGTANATAYLSETKDGCLTDNPTFKDRVECLQALVENYYGCPWDGVNHNTITPQITNTLNRSQLFHRAEHTCRVAHHVERYRFYSNVRQQIFVLGIYGALLLFLVTEFYSPEHKKHANGDVVLGRQLSEPAFLFVMWTLYNICNITLTASEDYFEFCESESDKVLQDVANKLGYVVVLVISYSRCRRLIALQASEDVESWHSFVQTSKKRDASYFMGVFLWYISPVLLACMYFAELTWARTTLLEKSLCFAGSRNLQSFFMHFGKMALEIVTVTVYAYGPSKDSAAFYSRYVGLILCTALSFVLLGLTIAGVEPLSYSYMMIPRVPDAKLSYRFVQLGHVFFVGLLGLFEPIRIGWPSHSTIVTKSSNDSLESIVENMVSAG